MSEVFDFSLKDLTQKLKEIINKEGGLFTYPLLIESEKLLPLKVTSLQNKTPIHERDTDGKHIFIQRFFKKEKIDSTTESSYREVTKQEFEKNPEEEADYYATLLFNALIFFFNDGFTYHFNPYDGDVEQNFCFIENEESYDLYGFYEYIGK